MTPIYADFYRLKEEAKSGIAETPNVALEAKDLTSTTKIICVNLQMDFLPNEYE